MTNLDVGVKRHLRERVINRLNSIVTQLEIKYDSNKCSHTSIGSTPVSTRKDQFEAKKEILRKHYIIRKWNIMP